MSFRVSVFGLCVMLQLSGCTYLKYAEVQQEYARIQKATPAQKNLKHLIDHQTFYIVGQTEDAGCHCRDLPMAVAAYATDTASYELVDSMSFANSGTHFGLNLPEGHYDLLVFADSNGNQQFDNDEVIGKHILQVDKRLAPENVISDLVIALGAKKQTLAITPFAVRQSSETRQSLFYPGGTLRDLKDPLFDRGMATLGMYDPAAFLEQAPTMFYALEEEQSHKVPVIFVHGIGGSAREFSALTEQLDRTLYKPWFFYYPSGGDLHQLSELFYRIFLSGKLIPKDGMPIVIIAHSMGGLIVREALNRYDSSRDNDVKLFITIATPFAGHPAAATGVNHGIMVLPAWRDLDPGSDFLKELFRVKTPSSIDYQLIYAFGNSKKIKVGENSDGVVPLSSQLRLEAQAEAKAQFGFDAGHADILQNKALLDYLIERISNVKTIFPDNHLKAIFKGGFDLPLNDYSPTLQYSVRNFGHYFVALNNGEIEPINESQQELLKLMRSERQPRSQIEREFLKFKKEFSEYFLKTKN
jgi:pimeloyl-ACP methyl ester carboxylesterase